MYLQNNNALRLYNILYAQNASSSQRHVAMLEQICNDFVVFFFLNVKRGVDGEKKSHLADPLIKQFLQ